MQIREGSPLTPEKIRKEPDEATPMRRENVRRHLLLQEVIFTKLKFDVIKI